MESEKGENMLEQNLPETPPPEYSIAPRASTREQARGKGEGVVPNVNTGNVNVPPVHSSLTISAIYLFSVDSVLYTLLWKMLAVETELEMCNYFSCVRRLDN